MDKEITAATPASRRIGRVTVAVLAVASIVVTSCSTTDNTSSMDVEKKVVIAHQEWEDAVAAANMAKVILQEYGYSVSLVELEHDRVWSGVADGDFDAMLSAWVPLHDEWFGPNGAATQRVHDAGIVFEGAGFGLIVPGYVPVESLTELNDHSELFGRTIVVPENSGFAAITQRMISSGQYDLSSWSVSPVAGAEIFDELEAAIEADEPIVLTMWSPHWIWAAYDLKYLTDPELVYDPLNDIRTMTRMGLDVDQPGAFAFFDQFDWTQFDIENVMLAMHHGQSPANAAQHWFDATRTEIEAELPRHEAFGK